MNYKECKEQLEGLIEHFNYGGRDFNATDIIAIKKMLSKIQKLKEVIDKAILELANIDGNLSNSQLSDRICNLIDILSEVE